MALPALECARSALRLLRSAVMAGIKDPSRNMGCQEIVICRRDFIPGVIGPTFI
ncbi:hypothetical protein [Mesorhizobium sp. CN2-181]|uniref:hypothetical protein n=1 Tax=Mesorhizobium yinganensis TaxID=3157707 RepID=UPI0032B6FA30